jgi:hypothetical protein
MFGNWNTCCKTEESKIVVTSLYIVCPKQLCLFKRARMFRAQMSIIGLSYNIERKAKCFVHSFTFWITQVCNGEIVKLFRQSVAERWL